MFTIIGIEYVSNIEKLHDFFNNFQFIWTNVNNFIWILLIQFFFFIRIIHGITRFERDSFEKLILHWTLHVQS